VLKATVKRANKNLAKHKLPPLPRADHAALAEAHIRKCLYALGEDPGIIMDEMGHTDPALPLRVYRQSMTPRRGPEGAAPSAHRRGSH
jgi:hypothetical protein